MLTAWSTPGAALIALSTGIPLPEAIGAFLFCAVLLVLTGLSGWADRLTRLIPETLANAMLAGILFSFGMKLFDSAQADPLLVAVLGLGLLGATVIGLFVILPPALVLSIAALALLSTIGNSLNAALQDPNDRDAALVTFVTTVSDISMLGIAAPFWALVLGMVARLWLHPNAHGWNFRA